MSDYFEALSPWADIDPKALKGITPRLDTLEGKTIGLLRNSKRAAQPILDLVQNKLKGDYPTIQFTEFANLKPNETITAQDAKDAFEEWVKGVDAVISAYGD